MLDCYRDTNDNSRLPFKVAYGVGHCRAYLWTADKRKVKGFPSLEAACEAGRQHESELAARYIANHSK